MRRVDRFCSAYLVFGLVVATACAGNRALRVPVAHSVLGAVLFGLMVLATWLQARTRLSAGNDGERLQVLAGVLFVLPFALVSLLWVGLGTPWDASPSENAMRYRVLAVSAIAVTAAFAVLHRLLLDAGERLYTTLALAPSVLGGAAYVVWTTFQLGVWEMSASGQPVVALAPMNQALDALLFFATALTYAATALFSLSLARAQQLSRVTTIAFVVVTVTALSLLTARGTSFPAPGTLGAPWYVTPGFIVGIPAMPWVVPYLLGVLLLRQAPRLERH